METNFCLSQYQKQDFTDGGKLYFLTYVFYHKINQKSTGRVGQIIYPSIVKMQSGPQDPPLLLLPIFEPFPQELILCKKFEEGSGFRESAEKFKIAEKTALQTALLQNRGQKSTSILRV